jgi:Skp family chaperone for outer membrane proteins
MKLISSMVVAALSVALPVFGAGQGPAPAQAGASASVKIAVIDIDRVAAESQPGKDLFDKLKEENDKLAAERAGREQEIRDMQAKAASEVLSADAKARLQREMERKSTDAKRWLEDAQREFQQRQQEEEEAFQRLLAPVVEAVAKEQGIGLILRATPGLTFVLDPKLDLTPLVVQRLNETHAVSPGAAEEPSTTPPSTPPPTPPPTPPQD